MNSIFTSAGFPLQDLVVGASIYLPPLFKVVFIGFFVWLMIHRLLRDWIYAGDIWHPLLLDLSLFALSLCFALLLLLLVG